jgi:putative membrane protein
MKGLPPDEQIKAPYRTKLALDRTLLAWIRTAIAMATFGFGLVAFFRSLRMTRGDPVSIRVHEGAIQFGIALIIVGIGAMLVAAISALRTLARLRRGDPLTMPRVPFAVLFSFLLAALGLVALWLLLRQR